MSEDGYTLAETLAALAMIGLAMTGLGQGVFVIAQFQSASNSTIARDQAARAANQGLQRLLADAGPFRGFDQESFVGRADSFRFSCGEAQTCSAQLAATAKGVRLTLQDAGGVPRSITLPGVVSARLSYSAMGATTSQWPPNPTGDQTLRAVSLSQVTQTGDVPLAVADLWIDHETPCVFDAVITDCRT